MDVTHKKNRIKDETSARQEVEGVNNFFHLAFVFLGLFYSSPFDKNDDRTEDDTQKHTETHNRKWTIGYTDNSD